MFHCKYIAPNITIDLNDIIEVYQLSSSARDGFGCLNWSTLIEVAKSYGMTEFDDLIYYAGCCERYISENRESKSKK